MADFAPGSFSIGQGDWMIDPRFLDFSSFLGLTERDAKGINWKADDKTRRQMKDVYDWAIFKSNSQEQSKIKKAVAELQKEIGVNWTGKLLVDRLWQHTTFDTKFQKHLTDLDKQKQEVVKEETLKRSGVPEKPMPSEIKPIKDVKIKQEEFKDSVKIEEVKTEQPKQEFI